MPGLRDVGDGFDQEGARFDLPEQLGLAHLGCQAPMRSRLFSVRVQQRIAELTRHAQQLVAVFIADAERKRHRHDAAADRRPEHVDELLVVVQEQDQLVAAPGAERCR